MQKLSHGTIEARLFPFLGRPRFESDDFSAGHVGYYLCNGAVITQEFGDRRADGKAREILTRLFPEREVLPLEFDGIAEGGGSISCATQQEPRA